MFGKKRGIVMQEKRRWKALIIPEENEVTLRIFRFLQSRTEKRVFVEKIQGYKLYVISKGFHPKSLEVVGIASDLKSAIKLSNNEITRINAGQG